VEENSGEDCLSLPLCLSIFSVQILLLLSYSASLTDCIGFPPKPRLGGIVGLWAPVSSLHKSCAS